MRSPAASSLRPRLRGSQGLLRRCGRVEALLERRQLLTGGVRAREQVVVVGGAEAAAGVADPLQLSLHVLDAVGLGLERGQEPTQVGAELAQPQLEIPQLLACAGELGCKPLERCERALGGGGEAGRAVALLGRKRLGRGLSSLGQLGDVAEPLPLGSERVLGPGLEALGRLDECGQLTQARFLAGRTAGQLLVPLPRGGQLAPRGPRLPTASELVLAAVGVEHVELVRRPCEPALLELAGHRDQALGGGGEILARHRAAPGVRPRAAVGEDAPSEHEARFVLGRELGEPGELLVLEEAVRQVELGLDVGLAGRGADRARVALRAEQEADRLGEDRLPGARLAGDRGQPGGGRELSLAHEDEILDPQATKQRSGCSG